MISSKIFDFLETHNRALQFACVLAFSGITWNFLPWEWFVPVAFVFGFFGLLNFGEGLNKGADLVKQTYREVYERDL